MKNILIFLLLLPLVLPAQQELSESQAIALVLKQHPAARAAALRVQQQKVLQGTAGTLEPTQIFHNISADPDLGMFGSTVLGVSQTLPAGRMVKATRQFYQQKEQQAGALQTLTQQQLILQVRDLYQHLSYLTGKAVLYERLDSIYRNFASIAETRYRLNEATLAEKLALEDKAAQIRLMRETTGHEIAFDQIALAQLLGLPEPVKAVAEPFRKIDFSMSDTSRIAQAAPALVSRSEITLAQAQQGIEQAKLRPSTSVGVLGQYLGNGAVYPGWQVSLQLPIAQKGYRKAIEGAALQVQVAQQEHNNLLLEQRMTLAHLLHEQEKFEILLNYYETRGRGLAAELFRSAVANYRAGEMDYVALAQLLEQAIGIELEYLENTHLLNRTTIEIQALTGF